MLSRLDIKGCGSFAAEQPQCDSLEAVKFSIKALCGTRPEGWMEHGAVYTARHVCIPLEAQNEQALPASGRPALQVGVKAWSKCRYDSSEDYYGGHPSLSEGHEWHIMTLPDHQTLDLIEITNVRAL